MPGSDQHVDAVESAGVVITLREIYTGLQEVVLTTRDMNTRLKGLEDKIRVQDDIDLRSREALSEASKALKAVKDMKESITWLWRTIIVTVLGGVITWVASGHHL